MGGKTTRKKLEGGVWNVGRHTVATNSHLVKKLKEGKTSNLHEEKAGRRGVPCPKYTRLLVEKLLFSGGKDRGERGRSNDH